MPDTPPATPIRNDYVPQPPVTPSDTSFLTPQSLSPLRNKLPTLPILCSKLSLHNFARPLTKIVDEKINNIQINPKKPIANINENNLSEQLQEVFPNINEVIEEDSARVKTEVDNLGEILSKIGEGDQVYDHLNLNLSFLLVGKMKNFIIISEILVFQVII